MGTQKQKSKVSPPHSRKSHLQQLGLQGQEREVILLSENHLKSNNADCRKAASKLH